MLTETQDSYTYMTTLYPNTTSIVVHCFLILSNTPKLYRIYSKTHSLPLSEQYFHLNFLDLLEFYFFYFLKLPFSINKISEKKKKKKGEKTKWHVLISFKYFILIYHFVSPQLMSTLVLFCKGGSEVNFIQFLQ